MSPVWRWKIWRALETGPTRRMDPLEKGRRGQAPEGGGGWLALMISDTVKQVFHDSMPGERF